MSVRVLNAVWQNSPQTANALLLLLAIADYADDNGVAWPSIEALQAKARCSERTVQRILQALVVDGELEIDLNAGPSGTNRYRVRTAAGRPLTLFSDTGDRSTPVTRVTPGTTSTPPRGTSPGTMTVTGATGDTGVKVTPPLRDPARPPTEREIARSQKATVDALWREFVELRKKRFGAAARHTDSIGKRAFAARVPAAFGRGCREADVRDAVRRLAEDDKQPSPWYLDDRAAAAKADREEREAADRKIAERAEEDRAARGNVTGQTDADKVVHIDRVRDAAGLARTGNANLDRMIDGLASRTELPSVGT